MASATNALPFFMEQTASIVVFELSSLRVLYSFLQRPNATMDGSSPAPIGCSWPIHTCTHLYTCGDWWGHCNIILRVRQSNVVWARMAHSPPDILLPPCLQCMAPHLSCLTMLRLVNGLYPTTEDSKWHTQSSNNTFHHRHVSFISLRWDQDLDSARAQKQISERLTNQWTINKSVNDWRISEQLTDQWTIDRSVNNWQNNKQLLIIGIAAVQVRGLLWAVHQALIKGEKTINFHVFSDSCSKLKCRTHYTI